MINELVQRLRDEMVEQSSRCGEEDSQDRALLAEEAANEIERLLKREKDLMDVIDSRDRALGFVPLDEVHASEPLQRHAKGCPCPDCLNGTTRSNIEQGASRDASQGPNAWADAKGGLPDNKL